MNHERNGALLMFGLLLIAWGVITAVMVIQHPGPEYPNRTETSGLHDGTLWGDEWVCVVENNRITECERLGED